MDAYIHIRSKLNPSCDSVRLIEVMKACIYTWLNLNLKPVFFLDRNGYTGDCTLYYTLGLSYQFLIRKPANYTFYVSVFRDEK